MTEPDPKWLTDAIDATALLTGISRHEYDCNSGLQRDHREYVLMVLEVLDLAVRSDERVQIIVRLADHYAPVICPRAVAPATPAPWLKAVLDASSHYTGLPRDTYELGTDGRPSRRRDFVLNMLAVLEPALRADERQQIAQHLARSRP